MFRQNVAALIKCEGKYLACKRSDYNSWQNVQGGIEEEDKNPAAAIVREIQEELGVQKKDFKIIYQSKFWRRYFFPSEILKRERFKSNVGQEQLWFLVELKNIEKINLKNSSGEFDKVKLLEIDEFLSFYSEWKLPAFYDFCREIDCV